MVTLQSIAMVAVWYFVQLQNCAGSSHDSIVVCSSFTPPPLPQIYTPIRGRDAIGLSRGSHNPRLPLTLMACLIEHVWHRWYNRLLTADDCIACKAGHTIVMPICVSESPLSCQLAQCKPCLQTLKIPLSFDDASLASVAAPNFP